MKVFRFMSKNEFQKYRVGEVLINRTEHKARTTSKGFCFMKMAEYVPEYAMNFLSGVVNGEICAVFDVEDKFLDETIGEYAKPLENKTLLDLYKNWGKSFYTKEYCTTTYSNKDFKLVSYCEEPFKSYLYGENWKWIICNR